MTSINAMRVAASRAKARQQLGDEEYLRRLAERQRKYTLKQRLLKQGQTEDSSVVANKIEVLNENCDDLLKSIIQAKQEVARSKASTITDGTIIQQFNKFKNIYKFMNDGKEMDCGDLTWVRDTDRVLDFIQNSDRWTTPVSKKNQISAIASIVSVIDGYGDVYKIYSETSTNQQKNISEVDDEVKLSDKEKENILPWNIIRGSYKKKIKKPDYMLKALVAITTLLPPRRTQDYQNLKLYNTDDELPDDVNILLMEQQKPIKLIYNVYKTSKTYGKQEFDIPKSLQNILLKFFEKTLKNIETGQFLFAGKNGKKLLNFTTKVQDAFMVYTGKPLSLNLLRHSFITELLSKKRTPAEKKKYAYAMGHSVQQQALYDRIDLDRDDKEPAIEEVDEN